MVPELDPKSSTSVMAQATTEKMSVIQNMDSKVATDAVAGVDGCTTSQANDIPAKQNIPNNELENPEVDVTDGVNPGKGNNGDTTDYPSGSSSSFDDTFSGADGALALSDDEINSELRGSGQPSWLYPGYEEAFRMRKKKLTSHWRNFIRPVMWRCKWAELQMKKFQSQASTYSRILAEYDKGKQSRLENFSAESQCSRSFPFPHPMKHKKIMRRKKRKRVEDTTDTASYMLHHNLFAYCEDKGISIDNSYMVNGFANPVSNTRINHVGNDDLLHFGDEETVFEQILAKIDSVQSRVHDLTTRVDKVINENPGKFSSLNELSLLAPCDSGASTAQDPTSPSSDKFPVTSPSLTTQPASEFHVTDPINPIMPSSDLHVDELTMTTTEMTSQQVADSAPEAVESADQPVVAFKSDKAEDELPLRKRPIKDELIVYRRGMLSARKRRMLSDKQSNNSASVSAMKPRIGLPQAQNEKSSVFLASRYTSLLTNQKKRGKRKGADSGQKKIVRES